MVTIALRRKTSQRRGYELEIRPTRTPQHPTHRYRLDNDHADDGNRPHDPDEFKQFAHSRATCCMPDTSRSSVRNDPSDHEYLYWNYDEGR
jgi:hypothetical protein